MRQERARVNAPAMWRVENDRPAPSRGLNNIKRWIEFVVDCWHGGRQDADKKDSTLPGFRHDIVSNVGVLILPA